MPRIRVGKGDTRPETVDLAMLDTRGVSSPADESRLGRGDVVGRYMVLEGLGEGGMGVVYRAFDPELDRTIALKLLRTEADADAQTTRIYREAQAMARLTHPNVVTVYDVGRDGKRVFIAMELVEGATLSSWLADEPRSSDTILDVFVSAGRGLAAAHVAGLVHRDFKPDNVLVGRDGRILVTDFGLARGEADGSLEQSVEPVSADELVSGRVLSSKLTRTGAILGTPAYMAPEQFRGAEVEPATDQFSFCIALYEALFGERPFPGDKPGAVALAVTTGERRALPRQTEISDRVIEAIDRGLRLEPAERWPTMELLLAELQPDPPGRRRRITMLGLAGGALGLVGLLAFFAYDSGGPCKGSEERMEAVWSGPRASAVRGAFERANVPMADTIGDRAIELLDAYAESWVATQIDACEATRVRGEQSDELLDLRTGCLQRRLDEMEAAAAVLVRPDSEVIANALDVVARIQPIETCNDVAALRADTPLPTDPDTRARIQTISAHVDRSYMLVAAGRYDRALIEAEQAVALAEEVGYLPATARAYGQLGVAYGRLEDVDRARAAYLRAWWGGIEVGADDDAAAAALGLSLLSRTHEEAVEWVEHGKAFARRDTVAPHLQLELTKAEASAHHRIEDNDRAIGLLREVIAMAESIESAKVVAAQATVQLAGIQRQTGRLDASLATFERARTLATKIYGASHPLFADIDRGMATTLLMKGETTAALEHARRAARDTRDAYGAQSMVTARAQLEVAIVLHKHGEFDESQDRFARGIALIEALVGPSEELAAALSNWGGTLDELGRFDEAVEKHRRALAAVESLADPRSSIEAHVRDNLGSALQGVGDYEAALVQHKLALPLYAELSTTDIHYGIALRDHARALIGLGREGDARPMLERALEVFTQGQFDPMEAELTRFHLGRALYADARTRKRGVQLVTAAYVWFGNAGPRAEKQLADTRAWLDAHDE